MTRELDPQVDASTETTPLTGGGHTPSGDVKSKLYVSHFLSTWNFRGFEFGAVLFLASIFPGTLLPMSIYALVRAGTSIAFASQVGQYIDHGNRLKVVRVSILWQRVAVVFSCVGFWVLLTQKLPVYAVYTIFGVNVALGCVERLCSTMNTISVERDWVIVIANDNESVLYSLNSQMRRIDLFCKLMSPLVVAMIHTFSPQVAILATLGANGVSMVIEYGLIARVYRVIPALASRCDWMPNDSSEEGEQRPSFIQRFMGQLYLIGENISTYKKQDAFLASVSLSILYLTVLSFGGQMVTFLLDSGYTSAVVAFARVGSSFCEMSATWIAPWLMSKIGPIRSGMWFLSFQMISLGIAVIAFWRFQEPLWAASALVLGTAFSRIGLWGFDLSAQVIIQEGVEAEYRGSFSTTESALKNFCEFLSYVSTIVFFEPADFKYPAIISIAAVYSSGVLYAKFVHMKRGHLLHYPKCLSREKLHPQQL
jgi:iron-regulated transporter 1